MQWQQQYNKTKERDSFNNNLLQQKQQQRTDNKNKISEKCTNLLFYDLTNCVLTCYTHTCTHTQNWQTLCRYKNVFMFPLSHP